MRCRIHVLALSVGGFPVAGFLVGALLLVFVAGAPASADELGFGPRITPATIEVESLAAPGSRLDLPALVVRNAGAEPLEVSMGASSEDSAAGEWASFQPASFRLAGGESRLVNARLEVPRDAPLGEHTVRLRAGTRAAGGTEGLGLGISLGVASTARFEVGWPPEGAVIRAGVSPWVYPAGVMAALVAGALGYFAMAALQHVEWQSPVRRKRPPSE